MDGSEAFVFKTPLLVGSQLCPWGRLPKGKHVPTDLSGPPPQQFVVKESQ